MGVGGGRGGGRGGEERGHWLLCQTSALGSSERMPTAQCCGDIASREEKTAAHLTQLLHNSRVADGRKPIYFALVREKVVTWLECVRARRFSFADALDNS